MSNEEEFNLAESIKTFMPLTKQVRVLVVDGDAACLTIVSKMLLTFGYKVMTATTAADAFSIIQEKEDELKLVLAEVHLPDMNRYEFIEKMTQVSKLPLVIMSDDDDDISMLGGLFKGAALYLVKPVTLNTMKTLWQFAYMNNIDLLAFSDCEEDNNNVNVVQTESADKRQREEEDDNDESKAPKKTKLVWSDELHTKFLLAVNELGVEDAHPKTILQRMNVSGLRKENISSHLQKYRVSLKQEQDAMLKRMSRGFGEPAGFASFPCSSSSSFPKLYFSSTTTCQPQLFGFPFQKNLITSTTHISMPNNSFASTSYISHPYPDGHDLYLMSKTSARMGITNNNSMELASFGIGELWESTNFIKEEEDVFNAKMSVCNLGVSDFGNIAKDFPTLLDNSQQVEQDEKQIPVLSTSPLQPPPEEKQGKGETEVFDFTKQSTVVFRDEDLDDLW